ncbi:MAG TPA: class I SAM-dependent methyltransferase [Verrucomicrobiae bacterium]
MNEPELTEYDRVTYPGYTHPQTHPDRMAVLGTLFGLNPAPVTACRVLEIGCGDATNLLPMACVLPQSQFVGVDLAPTPINRGTGLIRELGLANVRLVQADLSDMKSDWGRFDYIIAHGVYSWVPAEVREHLLGICHDLLSSSGIAFVSYNTFPGFHLRSMLREMMLFHVRGFPSAQDRVGQAQALVRFLAGGQQTHDEYRLWLKAECEGVLDHAEGHLYHDELGAVNDAFYFTQFVEAASRHGLQYLAEADFFEMSDGVFEDSTRVTLNRMAQNRVLREQYLDFLKCRRFRQTLLCRSAAGLAPEPRVESVARLRISSAAVCEPAMPDLHPGVNCVFETSKGGKCQTDLPLGKAALAILEEVWPASLPFAELLEQVCQALADKGIPVADMGVCRDMLSGFLLRLYGGGVVEFHTFQPPFAGEVGDRPLAPPLVRWQAAHGDWVTSLLHIAVKVEDEIGRTLLTWLDGTVDREQLRRRLWELVKEKKMAGLETAEDEKAQKELEVRLVEKLRQLARLGLLTDLAAAVPQKSARPEV